MPKSDIGTNLLTDSAEYSQAQVFISMPGQKQNQRGTRLNALFQGEFSISGGNSFNTPLASSGLENLSEKINIGKTVIQSAANQIGANVNVGSQVQLKTLSMTSNYWVGSEKPKFTLDLLFIALKRGDDVRDMVEPLYESVFPTVAKGGIYIRAPFGYNVDSQGQAIGTFAVQLGTWFRATKQVMTGVNFTYSKEMIPLDGAVNGTEATKFAPLYARGSIAFEPYRDITFNEFKGYYIR